MTSRRHFFGEDFRIARTKATEDKVRWVISALPVRSTSGPRKSDPNTQFIYDLRFTTYGLESEPPAARGGGAEAAFTLQNRAKKV